MWRQEVNRGTTPGLDGRTRTFAFRGTETVDGRQLARIDFTARTTVLPEGEPEPSLLFHKPHMEITCEDYTGTLYYDPAAGRLASAPRSTSTSNRKGAGRGGEKTSR